MIEHRQPISAAERELADELAVQFKRLMAGRTVAQCVQILTMINAGLDRDDEASVEPAKPTVN